MILVDSNILFSALIRDSLTRRLILEYDGKFLFPAYIFEEFEKHKNELLEKSCMGNFDSLLGIILEKVIIVPDKEICSYKKEAFEIIKDIDINDVTFIATALAYPGSIIWSNDRHLKKQSRIKVVNTTEMMKEL